MPIPFNPFSGLTAKIYGGVAIAAIAFGAVQTVRLDGFLWIDGAIEQRDNAKADLAKAITAGHQALAAQIKIHDETKAAYAAKAKEADREHEIELAAASDRTERFIAGNGVRKACGSRTIVASAPTESATPPRSDGPGSASDLVAVTPADVRLCTANSLRLKAVHDWGVVLREAGLAE